MRDIGNGQDIYIYITYSIDRHGHDDGKCLLSCMRNKYSTFKIKLKWCVSYSSLNHTACVSILEQYLLTVVVVLFYACIVCVLCI